MRHDHPDNMTCSQCRIEDLESILKIILDKLQDMSKHKLMQVAQPSRELLNRIPQNLKEELRNTNKIKECTNKRQIIEKPCPSCYGKNNYCYKCNGSGTIIVFRIVRLYGNFRNR